MPPVGTRRSTIARRYTGKRAIFFYWLRRFGVVFGGGAFVIWLGAWLYLSGTVTRSIQWTHNKTLQTTADMGFAVENILVEGRVNSDPEVILALVNVGKDDPLFAFDPGETQKQIEEIPWIKHARVERRLPDTVYIGLEEHQPLALWQKDQKLSLLAEDGSIIETGNLGRFKDLIIVIGEGAPMKAPELLANLAAEETLFRRTKAASWVGDRRWDLIFRNDITVKLPENDMGLALRSLGAAQEESAILDKDITSIDLREPGRMVVSPRAGAAQEYKAGLKTGNNI
jgi:cell division protein FtsQ